MTDKPPTKPFARIAWELNNNILRVCMYVCMYVNLQVWMLGQLYMDVEANATELMLDFLVRSDNLLSFPPTLSCSHA